MVREIVNDGELSGEGMKKKGEKRDESDGALKSVFSK